MYANFWTETRPLRTSLNKSTRIMQPQLASLEGERPC